MTDDDLDLDLDLGPELEPKGKAPAAKPAKVMADRKPGMFAKVGTSVTSGLSSLGPARWTLRNFLLVLAGLVILFVLGQNWQPVRFYLLGFGFELPKTIAFLLNMALGGLLVWWWLGRKSRPEA